MTAARLFRVGGGLYSDWAAGLNQSMDGGAISRDGSGAAPCPFENNETSWMIHINDSTLIDKPIRQVFDFMSTPENDFQWQYGTLASSRLAEGTATSGTFFRSIGHMLGRRVQGTFEVTDYQPNRKYGFKSLSGPLHSQTSYTFKFTSGNTLVSINTQASLLSASQVDERKLERRLKKQLKENLKMLKDLLEEKSPGRDA